jgi:hypothetical protein
MADYTHSQLTLSLFIASQVYTRSFRQADLPSWSRLSFRQTIIVRLCYSVPKPDAYGMLT